MIYEFGFIYDDGELTEEDIEDMEYEAARDKEDERLEAIERREERISMHHWIHHGERW